MWKEKQESSKAGNYCFSMQNKLLLVDRAEIANAPILPHFIFVDTLCVIYFIETQ